MDLHSMRTAITGVLAFAPTFFDPDGALDVDALGRHVHGLVESGTNAVVVAGGVGEFYALTSDEFADVVRTAVEAVGGRVPVFAGVGHATDAAVGLARSAADLGADGLMVNPLYFVRPEPAGLAEHYDRITGAAGLGAIVFSTSGQVSAERELEALTAVEAVIAVKHEVDDPGLFERCVRDFGDRFVWINGMAETRALDYARLGAVAMTSGIVNVDPAASLRVWRAAREGVVDELDELIAVRIAPFARLRGRRDGYHITVIKEALELVGRGSGRVRAPLRALDQDTRDELERHLAAVGLLETTRA